MLLVTNKTLAGCTPLVAAYLVVEQLVEKDRGRDADVQRVDVRVALRRKTFEAREYNGGEKRGCASLG
jgi:hypothetical protein